MSMKSVSSVSSASSASSSSKEDSNDQVGTAEEDVPQQDDQVEVNMEPVVEQKLKYPMAVFFIVVNEFCERFSYYGMRTVLALYLNDILNYDEDESTVIYHVFVMLCYFTPIFGASLADSFLGKFRTIFYLSILYACGNVLLSVASIPNLMPQRPPSLVALFIIALGTGGIKPCVSSFGAEQFVRPQQERQLEYFFTVFYFTINAGSLLSTYLTPVLRADVKCFDQETCYPLAFGVPAILFFVAVTIFVLGKRRYRMNEPQGNVMGQFFACIWHAIVRKIKSKGEKHDHWLDFATDRYEQSTIDDIKQVLRVLILYVPLPMFWALYDQQGSRWTFQATRMDGRIGSIDIKPDQLQLVNALMILALLPIFESFVYPTFKKCGLPLTLIQRMSIGCFLLSGAFIMSGIVELQLEPTYAKVPAAGETQLNFINSLPCNVELLYKNEKLDVNASQNAILRQLNANEPLSIKAHAIDNLCDAIMDNKNWEGNITGEATKGYTVVITIDHDKKLLLTRMNDADQIEKSKLGLPNIGFIFIKGNGNNEDIVLSNEQHTYNFPQKNGSVDDPTIMRTDSKDIDEPGTYDITQNGTTFGKITTSPGGVYLLLLQNDHPDKTVQIEMSPPNSIHMLWLIPQYFVLTVAEVMYAVSGNQFAFTQAPLSMRAVLTGFFQLTDAFGNLIIVIVTEANSIPRQAVSFFLFSGLLVVATIIFILLSLRYNYYTPPEEQAEEKLVEKSNSNESIDHAHDNEAQEE